MNAFDRKHKTVDVRALTAYSALALEAPVQTEVLPTTARWEGVLAVEDELTGDGRLIQGGALAWADDLGEHPAPLRFVSEDVGFHDGAVVVGGIDSIERRDGGVIWGEGPLYMDTEEGQKAYLAIRDKRQTGVSLDLDSVSFEVRVAAELLEGWDEPMEVPEPGPDGKVVVATINADDEVMVTTSARIRAATDVAVPAFATARIGIQAENEEADDLDASPPGSDELASVVAAAAPVTPPRAWFENPALTEPTPLTVTKDGRVYGHIALWGTCHVSHTAAGKCITPPNSPSGYAYFHTGALETAEGDLIDVGHLTMSTGHAADDLSAFDTISHYDNTGTVAADVRAYEDKFGIAVAGGLRPRLTPEQVREFRAAPISGDWRRIRNGLELVAGLSVNVPGFGVPRPSGRTEKDSLVSLRAAGIIVPITEANVTTLSHADLTYLRRFLDRERRAELAALVARRNRVKVATFVRRRKG